MTQLHKARGVPVEAGMNDPLRVARLSITPIRSFALQHPDSVELTEHGVLEDRRFALLTPDGRIFDALKFGPLMQIRVDLALDPERLALHFPSGETVDGDVRLGTPFMADVYGRTFAARPVIGPWDEALSGYCGQTVRLVRSERRRQERDRHPVSIVTTASVDELSRKANHGVGLDARRFRMLIEVGAAAPREEDGWVGHEVRIGNATVRVTVPDPRCAITTLDPATGRRDFATLHAIKRDRGLRDGRHIDFGVYADVTVPGTIRLGDTVTPMFDSGA